MTDVLMVGAFGQRNPGDDALLRSFRAALTDARVTVASDDVGRPVAGVRLVPSRSPRRLAQVLWRSRVLVVAGGVVFKTLPRHTGRPPHDLLRRALLLTHAARAAGRRVAFVGVGAGALGDRQARVLARRVARTADLLVLRDSASAQALLQLGVPGPLRVGADPTWTLPMDLDPDAERDGVLVIVSRQADAGAMVPALADGLAALGLPVRVAPWQLGGTGPDDLDVARLLRQALVARGLDAHILLPPGGLDDAAVQAAAARVVVTARFHGIVAAARAGTPSVALAHEPKLAALSAELGQPAVRPAAAPDELCQAVRDALARGSAAPAVVARQQALAEDGFRLLRLLVSGGESFADEDAPALPYVPAVPDVVT